MSQTRIPKKLSEEDKEKLKAAFDVSHFDINAILRGAQLTLVGGKLLWRPDPMLTTVSSS